MFPQTAMITELATTTTEVLETTATVVTSTVILAPTEGILKVLGSSFDGKYAHFDFPNDDGASSHLIISQFYDDPDLATPMIVTAGGELKETGSAFGSGYQANSANSRVSTLYLDPSYYIQQQDLITLVCATAPITGLLTCTRDLGDGPIPIVFQQCDAKINSETTGYGVVISDRVEDGCNNFEFLLVPKPADPEQLE
ncbi:hypothetical protein PG984_011640 [Apiospora sp. TS-2023a]